MISKFIEYIHVQQRCQPGKLENSVKSHIGHALPKGGRVRGLSPSHCWRRSYVKTFRGSDGAIWWHLRAKLHPYPHYYYASLNHSNYVV